ncbi:patatin-like phospholipase family protein [Streptomyces mirabilis]|uniref:patatin-like phospholipase family protein n=1 Tax=Streptomyces mirabilis TaxID=68239 RepID=UPI003717D213
MADTALVLGGGGLTAYAWQVGMLAGLADAGLQLGGADVLAGTSAGSLLAVELAAGAEPADLYEVQVARKRAMMEVDFTFFMTVKYLWAALGSRDPATVVKRLGRLSRSQRLDHGVPVRALTLRAAVVNTHVRSSRIGLAEPRPERSAAAAPWACC